jgi:MarR family transcriptional regulator, organic hydroperoxide resistance regulator
MSSPELLLSNQLCFLVHRLDLDIAARYRPVLVELGLTYGQYLAMLALWERRELAIGELCELLRLDTGTVSPMVKRLAAAGLVKRERGREDERMVVVRLSDAGAALEEKARRVPAVLAGCLVADEADYLDIRERLEGMLSRLDSSATCAAGSDRAG